MNNLNQTALSLTAQGGLGLFDPAVIKDRVADVTLRKTTMEEALKKMRRGSTDKAVEAGYTPEAREEVLSWSNELSEMYGQIANVEIALDRYCAMDAQLTETAAEMHRRPLPDSRDGFLQVIARLGKSKHEFQLILDALGASGSLTPEIQEMLETAGVAAEAELAGVDCTQPSQMLSFRGSRHPEPSVEKLKSRLNSLEDELEAARQEAKASAASAESRTREFDTLRQDLSVEKANARRLKDKADKSAAEVLKLDVLIRDQRISATSIQLDLDDKSQELNACLETLDERDKDLEATKAKLSSRDEDLAAAMVKLGARDLEITAHRSVLQDRGEQLRDSNRQLTAVRDELEESKRQFTKAQEDLLDREGRLLDSTSSLKRVREELSKHSLESAKELTQIRSDLRVREREIQDVTLQGAQDMSMRRQESARELAEAHSSLRDHEKKILGTSQQLVEVQEKLQDSNRQLANLQAESKDRVEKLAQELSASQRDLQDSAQLIATVRGDLNSSNQQLTDVRAEVWDLEEKLRNSTLELTKGRAEMAETHRVNMRKTDAAASVMSMAGLGSDCQLLSLVNSVSDDPFTETSSEPTKSWKILPPLSSDESLKQPVDPRKAGAIIMDALASVQARDIPKLWAVMSALNGALSEPVVVPLTVVKMLLDALADIMPNPELHLVHRVVMGVVATSLGHAWPLVMSQVHRVVRAIKTSDPKAAQVVNGLFAVEPVFDNSIESMYGLLVGFNFEPRGVLIINLGNTTIQWVDQINPGLGKAWLGEDMMVPMPGFGALSWWCKHALPE